MNDISITDSYGRIGYEEAYNILRSDDIDTYSEEYREALETAILALEIMIPEKACIKEINVCGRKRQIIECPVCYYYNSLERETCEFCGKKLIHD